MILGRLAAPIRVAFLVTSLRDLPLNASRYLRAFFPLVYAVFVMGGSSARAEVPLEVSLVTGKPLGRLAVAGRLAIDLHAEFMMSRTYDTDTVLNWYNCGYSGRGGEGGAVTEVGGNFGDFGFQVPTADRVKRYPKAVRVDDVPAASFDGDDFLKGNFPIEQSILDSRKMTIEVWLRSEHAKPGQVILGWQSPDGKETSGPLALPEEFRGSPDWRHLVVTRVSDGETWLLDGKQVTPPKKVMEIAAGHVPVLGGATAAEQSFVGDLAAVRLHDDVLSPEEIAHNRTGGPLLGTEMHDWWRTEDDQWWSENSEHFRHAIDRKEMDAWPEKQRKEFDDRKASMFKLAELAYHCYSQRLALRTSVVSRRRADRGDGIRYRTPIQPTAGGNYMGVDDRFGWSCQFPGFINPHELVHGWDVQTGNMAGNYWESHANFPQTYLGIYQTIPLLTMESSGFPCMGRTYYHDRLMFEHLAQTPDYGPMFIAKMWYDGPTRRSDAPYPWQTFERINPFPDRTLGDEYTRMARRNMTVDFQTFVEAAEGPGNTPFGNDGLVSPVNRYKKVFDDHMNNPERTLRRWARVLLRPIAHEPGWWRVPKEQAPQQLGWNICPLSCSPGEVTATLIGYADSARGADWRSGFVGVAADGSPVYGDIFRPGTTARFTVPDGMKELSLVVCGTPTKILEIPMTGDFRSFEQRQFPYKVKFTGCEPLDVLQAEPPPEPGAPHANGGGFVAETAKVDATAYVGPQARVLGKAEVRGQARIEDQAVVRDAVAQDEAVVSGHALVHEGSTVKDRAKVRDRAVVANRTTVADDARILEHARVASAKTCGGRTTVKGLAVVYGGNQTGTPVIDGFYAKANDISKGAWFTWSWGVGQNPGERDEELGGLAAEYTFDDPHESFVGDAVGTNWGYLAGGANIVSVPDRPRAARFADETLPALDFARGDAGDHYVAGMFGYLKPPETGDYTLWIAGDDVGELWIGAADTDAADTLACLFTKPGPHHNFTLFPGQKSAPIRLEAGRLYPVAVLHQQIQHGQHVAVAWTKPGGDKPEIIGGEALVTDRDAGTPGVRRRTWRGAPSITAVMAHPDYDPLLRPKPEFDGALLLDGVDDFVELPANLADLSDCTFTAEVKWDGGADDARIFECSNAAGDAMGLFPARQGKLLFAMRKGKVVETVSAPPLQKNRWTKVQVLVNGSTATLMVDGKKVGENNAITLRPESIAATELYLGRGRKGGFFGGSIGSFTVHGVALNDTSPPAPDPAAFESAPLFVTPDTLTMTATAGTDPLGNVEYFFQEQGGAWKSGWQKANSITIGDKDWSRPARYRVKMRDTLGNETQFSTFMPAEGRPKDVAVYGVDESGPTVIEAEHCARNATAGGVQWELVNAPAGFVGAGCMQVPDKGASPHEPPCARAPRMDYFVHFAKPGRHFVWVRGFAVNPAGDSVHMGLDMKLDWGANVGVGGSGFVWSGPRPFEVVKPGLHTFSIWAREDGAIVDRILFTADAGYVPDPETRSPKKELIGEGPAESPTQPWPAPR
jgi:hypothetical protein